MDLREILSGNKSAEFLWSLSIEPDWIQAGIWTISDGEAKVVAVSSPVAWEKEEDLISATDTALSSAAQSLPDTAAEPNKVVFGVPASWVSEGSIEKARLESLKVLCAKLTLTPAGFVTLPEAVAFYMKSQEGSPLTAVTLALGKELLEISVFRIGNLMGSTQVARSVSLFDDVVEGLSRFGLQDPIPSRFILINGKEGELEEAKQALIGGNWEELSKIKLMHTPKIETLTSEKKVEAVSLGGATEIAKVSKVKLMTGETKDLSGKVEEAKEESEAMPESESQTPDLGFVVDQDIANVEEVENIPESENFTEPNTSKKSRMYLSKIKEKLMTFWSGSRRPALVGAIAIIVVGVGVFAFWWFYPKATVTIFVSPQKLDTRTTVVISPDQKEPNLDEAILPGRLASAKLSGDRTTSTTGSKTVGDKSKGEMEIRNGTVNELELSAGTVLIAGNSLEFVLDESVTVPAKTSTTEPGRKKVGATAGDIGPEYNLPEGETYKVGTYSRLEVEAESTGDFSGGTSRQIDAVSQEDRERVLSELTAELTEKGKESISTDISQEEFFIDETAKATVVDEEYSGKVGDEADSIKVNLEVEVTGLVVLKGELFEFAQKSLSEKVPQGYLLRETQVEYSFDLTEFNEDKNTYKLGGTMSANLLPEVDTQKIANDIAGRYPDVAQEYLAKIPGFTRAQISISPRFPGRLGSLPRVVGNITVDLAAER